jgi:hypothetical protein
MNCPASPLSNCVVFPSSVRHTSRRYVMRTPPCNENTVADNLNPDSSRCSFQKLTARELPDKPSGRLQSVNCLRSRCSVEMPDQDIAALYACTTAVHEK